jgi:hypothetical protein
MKRRAQDKELFEKNLRETRGRYQGAIAFLRERGERIVEVNANSSILEVLKSIIGVLGRYGPDWLVVQPILSIDLLPHVFSLDGESDLKIADVALQFRHHWEQGPILNENEFQESLEALCQEIRDEILEMPFNDLGSLFLDYITQSGYEVGEKLAWSDLDAFEVEYAMPMNIKQRGIALLIGEAQRYDVILRKAQTISQMSDFMLVFSPGASELINRYYERDLISYSDGTMSLSPTTQLISREDIAKSVLSAALVFCCDEHFQTITGLPRIKAVFRNFCRELDSEGPSESWNQPR